MRTIENDKERKNDTTIKGENVKTRTVQVNPGPLGNKKKPSVLLRVKWANMAAPNVIFLCASKADPNFPNPYLLVFSSISIYLESEKSRIGRVSSSYSS